MRHMHSRNIYSHNFKELATGVLVIDAFSIIVLFGYNGFILGDCLGRHSLLQTYLFYVVVLLLLGMTLVFSVIDYRHLLAENLTEARWWKPVYIAVWPIVSCLFALLIILIYP